MGKRISFLTAVNQLFTAEAVSQNNDMTSAVEKPAEAGSGVVDLPEEPVRQIFQKAKKQTPQAYALVYLLFGAGLRLEECAGLMRSQVFASKNQHLLTLTGSHARQVPVNRWIMGNRYGTYLKNPLTQWLKSRSDDAPAVFITESAEATSGKASEENLLALWNSVIEEVETSVGLSLTPFRARQTWCIELLTKGMSLDNLSLLSGLSLDELAPYARRTKEKAALEQALAIDQSR